MMIKNFMSLSHWRVISDATGIFLYHSPHFFRKEKEITAFAEVMREKGVKIHPEREVIDIVGTGGDDEERIYPGDWKRRCIRK